MGEGDTRRSARAKGSGDHGLEARPPQQERGQRRVDAILDGAAQMIAEVGLADISMHGIARRSRATVGSLYHFFPELSCVLRGLSERHSRSVRSLLRDLDESATDWATLSTRETVDRFIDPLLRYLEDNPDLRQLIAHGQQPLGGPGNPVDRLMTELTERVVAARQPRTPPARRSVRAAMVRTTVVGFAHFTSRSPESRHPALTHELKQALIAYLDAPAPTRQTRIVAACASDRRAGHVRRCASSVAERRAPADSAARARAAQGAPTSLEGAGCEPA